MEIHPADSAGSILQILQDGDRNGAAHYMQLRGILFSAIMFFGKPLIEPKEISTASVRDLCLFIRVTGLLDVC
jgi:hypothetical protein